MKPGNQLGSIWTSYTGEFSTGVWACLLALVFAGTLVYSLISKSHPAETFRMRPGEAFMIALGAITAQCETSRESLMI